MPESEELKLSVSFVDNASAGLNKLRTDLERMGGGDAARKVNKQLEEVGGGKHLEGFKKVGEHLEGLRRQMSVFAEKGSGPLSEGLEKVSRMFLGVGRSGGIALGALGAVGASMYAVQRKATDFADAMEKLSAASRNTGLGMAQIKELNNALRDSRIKPEEFNQYAQFLSRYSADIQKESSELTTYLRNVAGTNGEMMERFIQDQRKLIKEGATGEWMTNALQMAKKMRDAAIADGKDAARATQEVLEVMRKIGMPETALRDFEHVKTATAEQEAAIKRLSDETDKYNEKVAKNSTLWEHVSEKIGQVAWKIAEGPMNKLQDLTKTTLEGMEHGLDLIINKFKSFEEMKKNKETVESKVEAEPYEPQETKETPAAYAKRVKAGGKSQRQLIRESLDAQYGGGETDLLGGGLPALKPGFKVGPVLQQFANVRGGEWHPDLSKGDITANFPQSSNIEDRRDEAQARERYMDENTEQLKRLNDYLTGQTARTAAGGAGTAGAQAVGLMSGGTGGGGGLGGGGAYMGGLGGLPGVPGGTGAGPSGPGPGVGAGSRSGSGPGTGSVAGEGGPPPTPPGAGTPAPPRSIAPSKRAPGGTEGQRGEALYQQMLAKYKNSKVVGWVPPDGARFGIKTGSAEEWARFATSVAHAESSFNPATKNTSDSGGSYGVFQYAHNQVPGGNAYDTDKSADAFVRDSEQAMGSGGLRAKDSLLRRRFSTIGKHPNVGARYLPQAQHFGEQQTASTPPETQPKTGAIAGEGGAQSNAPGAGVAGSGGGLKSGKVLSSEGVDAFIMHHTSGRTSVEGVENTLRQRHLGVEYIMDREGNITQFSGKGAAHMKKGWGKGAGLSNRNTLGMEVIAKDDKDVTPAQRAAAAEFIRKNYPNLPVYGHGEVNPGHKEADEGMTIVNSIRREREFAGRKAPPTDDTPTKTAEDGPTRSRNYMDMQHARSITHRVHGEASVDVNVNAPAGTTVAAQGKGLFRKIRTNRQVQMAQADTGPKNSTAPSIEE